MVPAGPAPRPNRPAPCSQSYGYGFRTNIFGLLVLRWDYAIPINRPGSKGFGTWFFGPSF